MSLDDLKAKELSDLLKVDRNNRLIPVWYKMVKSDLLKAVKDKFDYRDGRLIPKLNKFVDKVKSKTKSDKCAGMKREIDDLKDKLEKEKRKCDTKLRAAEKKATPMKASPKKGLDFSLLDTDTKKPPVFSPPSESLFFPSPSPSPPTPPPAQPQESDQLANFILAYGKFEKDNNKENEKKVVSAWDKLGAKDKQTANFTYKFTKQPFAFWSAINNAFRARIIDIRVGGITDSPTANPVDMRNQFKRDGIGYLLNAKRGPPTVPKRTPPTDKVPTPRSPEDTCIQDYRQKLNLPLKERGRKVGEGQYGAVYLLCEAPDKCSYVVKEQLLNDPGEKLAFTNEIRAMKSLQGVDATLTYQGRTYNWAIVPKLYGDGTCVNSRGRTVGYYIMEALNKKCINNIMLARKRMSPNLLSTMTWTAFKTAEQLGWLMVDSHEGNIMCNSQGYPVIIDWGWAYSVRDPVAGVNGALDHPLMYHKKKKGRRVEAKDWKGFRGTQYANLTDWLYDPELYRLAGIR